MRLVAECEAPPLTERDTRLRDDPEWLEAAAAYVEAKRSADSAAETLNAVKAKLVSLANHASESGGGVSITRYWRMGVIDYKKIPAIDTIDLEQFRGAGREEVRVLLDH
jgi:hypothetical protein